jgi:hypothetical protein
MPLSLLTKSAPSGMLLSAVGIGALVEALALGIGETGKIFGLLVLSAALTAIAQQSLPWGPNAVYGIASSEVHRNQAGRSWITYADWAWQPAA